jgi:rhodanese-related sulfurtransferase
MNTISIQSLKERIANNEALHLLDVREIEERNEAI